MKTYKVRITKSNKPDYWYADRIGEIFEVCFREDRRILVREDLNKLAAYGHGRSIDEDDCVVIKESDLLLVEIRDYLKEIYDLLWEMRHPE